MKITDNFEEMTELGRHFFVEHTDMYPPGYLQAMRDRYGQFAKNEEQFLALFYFSVYCRQMYGTSITEAWYYRFAGKTHRERAEYITWDNRFLYMAFLNKTAYNHILDNKYEAYTLLKPFYKREAILLADEQNYDLFCSFVRHHPAIFVKPNNLELAEGTHPLVCRDTLRETFYALLQEAAELSSTDVKRPIDHRLILEEYLVPSDFIRQLNPAEISLLRVTTIFVKGQVHFFYPCLRLLVGDGVERRGEDYSYVALIDPESGKTVTNGKNGTGDTDVNPITGKPIIGMQLPDWDELKTMLTAAARQLPNTRYIGWDVTHTDKGWCIIEGNTNGEFFYQMAVGHGVKQELEDLIGFHVPYDFWKNPMFQKKTKIHKEQE